MFFSQLGQGIAAGTNITIGNSIGAKKVPLAKTFAKYALLIAFIAGLFCSLLLFLFRNIIIHELVSSDEVRKYVLEAFSLIYLNVIFELIAKCGQGTIMGVGKQGVGSIFTLIGKEFNF